ncbi:DUF2269 domain-containing protein [Streptomyces sp. NPDC001941]|uniref:DUF2269 domain-containing protein n=1 Tax=Streptomyces sp. NPDC001941 TaxID=3154659 RepID=UPI00331A764D
MEQRTRPTKRLGRRPRRAWLVVHVAVSVSWLGLTLGLLALGITAYTTEDASLTAASYRAMRVFADWLLVPVSLIALLSGVVLSLGTPWGLALHRWVWIKFWLTLVTAGATIFSLRPGILRSAADGIANPSLVAAPSVATSAYFFMTAVSVLKPWGPTRRGRRLRAATNVRPAVSTSSRKTLDGRSPRRTA